MPRALRRAAVLGTTAHVASQRGQAAGAAAATQAAPPQAAVPAPSAPADSTYDDLMKLKQLLDAGALSQAEYDVQKRKLLS